MIKNTLHLRKNYVNTYHQENFIMMNKDKTICFITKLILIYIDDSHLIKTDEKDNN